MKVIDFIRKLEEIGYDTNTELIFGCIEGDSGTWCQLSPDIDEESGSSFCYGECLTGEPYKNDVIEFCLDVDGCKGYLSLKADYIKSDLIEDINRAINNFTR